MRDIKFRSWDAEQKEFNTFDLLGRYDDHAYYLLDTDNVEQFTGLQDRSGVDIYVGDIVKTDFDWLCGGVVKFGRGFFGVEHHDGWDKKINSAITEHHHKFEVIGNIHQNPELVEK